MTDKIPRTMQAWSYFNIVFGIVLAWTDLVTDFNAVIELWSGKIPIYIFFGLLMLLFIILPFVVQTVTINVYLKRHVSPETYNIACIFTFFLCPFLDMFLPFIYLGSFVCFKHVKKFYNNSIRSEIRAFLDSYQKIHSVSESLMEALPQTILQAYIYFDVFAKTKETIVQSCLLFKTQYFFHFVFQL